MLSRRFPSRALSGTPPRVYTNWALRDVFSSVTKAVWYTPDARVIDIRFKLVRAISELDLPLWPRSVNVPMDHPDASEATTFPPRRHNNDILLELEQAVKELVLLHRVSLTLPHLPLAMVFSLQSICTNSAIMELPNIPYLASSPSPELSINSLRFETSVFPFPLPNFPSFPLPRFC